MAIKRINPSSLGQPGGYHHVVKDGKTIYLAGQVARDRDGKTVGVGDASAHAEQVFRNIQAALESVGSDLGHILKMTTFMAHREDFPAYRAARSKFLTDDDALPASTLILCSGLADPDFRIKIEAVAAIP
jgi:enamine deaminase RidA (YjgF/YER057c/UK114 family)